MTQALCCGRHCVSPHSELLTWDALKGTSRESAFSLLLLGTSCPGSSWEPVTNKGRTHSNKVSGCQATCCVDCCAWVYSVLETQLLFVPSSTLAPKTPG